MLTLCSLFPAAFSTHAQGKLSPVDNLFDEFSLSFRVWIICKGTWIFWQRRLLPQLWRWTPCKTPMSSNSEAALALADDPRGLFMVIRCPKAREAVLGSEFLDVTPIKRPEETSLFQESFTKHMLAQLLGLWLIWVFCHQAGHLFIALYYRSVGSKSYSWLKPQWDLCPFSAGSCRQPPAPITSSLYCGKKPLQGIFYAVQRNVSPIPLSGSDNWYDTCYLIIFNEKTICSFAALLL